MATQQNLLPLLCFLFFKIGVSTAQNRMPITIQNDASEYPTLLFHHYFKRHKAIFESCGLYFDAKLQETRFNSPDIGLNIRFSLKPNRDSFECIVRNERTNDSIFAKYHYNITNEKTNEPLLRQWEDTFLNILFQIDASLITKVTDFKPLLLLVKSKETLLTHDNLLKNSNLCDLLETNDSLTLNHFAKNSYIMPWKKIFVNSYETLIVPFDSQCSFKTLKYLTNIKKIKLKGNWNRDLLKDAELAYLKKAGISIGILEMTGQKKEDLSKIFRDYGIKIIE